MAVCEAGFLLLRWVPLTLSNWAAPHHYLAAARSACRFSTLTVEATSAMFCPRAPVCCA